jgi:ligand-binding sensor domain-containing protein/signal transduction histidine kinase
MKEPYLKKAAIFFILLVILFPFLHSQVYSIKNYLKKDGLISTVVLSLCQDSRGYLWVGTKKGLCRFNGQRFDFIKTTRKIEPYIITILEDMDGNLWLGTGKGVICLVDGRTVTDMSDRPDAPGALSRGKVYAILRDDDNHIWFGTDSGLIRYDGNVFESFTTQHGLLSNVVVGLEKGPDGIWVACKGGVGYFRDERFQELHMPKRYRNEIFYRLLQEPGGKLWVGTYSGLIGYKDGVFATYREEDGFIDSRVSSLLLDSRGDIWVGTWKGITRFSGNTTTAVNVHNGLISNFTYAMLEDREGNIWVATHNGLSCVKSINIASYSKKDGLPSGIVYDMIQDKKNRYWFGTDIGLGCLENGTFKTYTTGDGLPHNAVYALLEDRKGTIWIGTLEGLATYSNGIFTSNLEQNRQIYELKETRDGSVWIGSSSGLHRWRSGNMERSLPTFSPQRPSATSKKSTIQVYFILEDRQGDRWYSTSDGLYRYSKKDGNRKISDAHVLVIFEDRRGSVWVGSGDGLSRYGNETVTRYTVKDGLPDNTCNVLLEDDDGILWLGTEKGIASFDGNSFRLYTALRHGFLSDSWNTGFKDRQGRIWMGGPDGVTRFLPPPTVFNDVPPPVYITGVKVLEEEMPIQRLGNLGPKQNYIRFRFTGLCTSAPESVVYRYKLNDVNTVDTGWQETQETMAIYPFLPSGEYRFMVKAVNNDGVESTEAAEVAFRIMPPFWRTWWFLTLAVLSAMFFTGMLVRWRYIRSKEKSELEAKNKMLVMAQRMELMGTLAAGTVHDLKNLLSIILGYTRVMSRKFHPGDDEHQHLETIKDTAGTAVQMSSQILSLARYPEELPGEVELGELLEEILKTLRITMPETIEIEEHLPEEPVRFAIHPARFQQVVLNLCQNASHAMPGGGMLSVSLTRNGEKGFALEIRDTGTGIPVDVCDKIFEPLFTTKKKGKGTGLGLFVVKQIVEQYGGTIEARSKIGEGTTFMIRFGIRK